MSEETKSLEDQGTLSVEAADTKHDEVEALKKELEKLRRQYQKAEAYNDDLRKQVERLSSELLNWRLAEKNRISVAVQVTEKEIDEAVSNADWLVASEKANLSVADCVRAAAEEVTRQSGYVFDEASGYYYDSASGYYYDAERSLYYDSKSGIYFYYNLETQKYEFHSQIDVTKLQEASEESKGDMESAMEVDTHQHESEEENGDDTRRRKKTKLMKETNARNGRKKEESDDDVELISISDDSDIRSVLSSAEEGECSDSSDDASDRDAKKSRLKNEDKPLEETGSQWPPCVRLIIKETNVEDLSVGSLFIVTCVGTLVGREKDCDIYLPDVEVSKSHAEICYSDVDGAYYVKDLGSQNGTYLNDTRLSKPKEASEQRTIKHDDVVRFGGTKLLLHIHKGNETCDDCEPGQVKAAYVAANPPAKEIKILSKEEKEQERKRALKQIKKKFGLEASLYENAADPTGPDYTDRANQRRITKGSDNPYEKTEVASLESAIPSKNKGFKMMEKMGWTSGQSLGKSQPGRLEPIPVEGQISKAGFGHSETHIRPVRKPANKKTNWKKVQQRYNNLPDAHELLDIEDD